MENKTIIINNIEKLSLNNYYNLHWRKRKEFKDNLKVLLYKEFKNQLESGYNLFFNFEFIGKKIDTINVAHYCKIIEDAIFKQDNKNGCICIRVEKGLINKVDLKIEKIKD